MLEEIKSKFKHFMKILDLIESKQSHYDGISYITQKEISSKLKISQTNVNSKLNLLEKYGAINKIKAGQYRLLNNNINFTPYRNVVKVALLLSNDNSLIGEYKKQSEILNLELKEVQQAWGYIIHLFLNENN
ncbi:MULTISPECIES: hypothetical protein [Cytobacillus]|nr:hypothetical protein [Cytobacillus oceanisediminis]EFV74938.1 hypothetical protein HMPREF1013_04815 [Bacillus sp. 2_A_57_CT2]